MFVLHNERSCTYVDKWGKNPLIIAISNYNENGPKLTNKYIKSLANHITICQMDIDDKYPVDYYLTEFAEEIKYEIVKLLLNENVTRNFDSVFFAFGFIKDYLELAKLLLDNTFLNLVNDENKTLLHRYMDNLDFISFNIVKLIVTKENKKIKDANGYTPLQYYYNVAHKYFGWEKYEMIYDQIIIKLLL